MEQREGYVLLIGMAAVLTEFILSFQSGDSHFKANNAIENFALQDALSASPPDLVLSPPAEHEKQLVDDYEQKLKWQSCEPA